MNHKAAVEFVTLLSYPVRLKQHLAKKKLACMFPM